MSDKRRILAVLRRQPVNSTDFMLPGVCDGGKPILRVPARIKDLKAEGYEIDRRMEKNGTATYILTFDIERGGDSAPTPSQASAASLPADAASLDAEGLFDSQAFADRSHWRAA